MANRIDWQGAKNTVAVLVKTTQILGEGVAAAAATAAAGALKGAATKAGAVAASAAASGAATGQNLAMAAMQSALARALQSGVQSGVQGAAQGLMRAMTQGLGDLPGMGKLSELDLSPMLQSPQALQAVAGIQAQYLADVARLWAATAASAPGARAPAAGFAPQGLASGAADAAAAVGFKLPEFFAKGLAGLGLAMPELGGAAREQLPALTDRRFAHPAWGESASAQFLASMYLINARALNALAGAVVADPKTQARVRFAVGQLVDAASPANFLATNPEAIKKAIDTKGASLARGVQNLLGDIRQGHMSLTDESQFEVGRNVATTEGAVVFENPFFQLIEYRPLTEKVYAKPFLIIPPCINKFYILDLQPANSLVRYSVAQGHRTFVLSWRNADASLAHATWDDYIEQAAICAIETVRQITKARQINALGFCVGGTILTTALAVLAARGQAASEASGKPPAASPVASATLLTTLLDFSDTGILDIFVDESTVRRREKKLAKGGLLKGQELASTFSMLRPNDLVWNYVQGNYLKGDTPPPFDLLYWNSDATNLPGPMYTWYLRNTYLENGLAAPQLRGAKPVTVCGVPVDLRRVSMPVYIYGSREDHIVPIAAAYASTQLLPGAKRFVMGASGHIAGVINPPAAGKRSHWINEAANLQPPATHAQWLAGAQEHAGSWWGDWSQWLVSHAGRRLAAPTKLGGHGFEEIEPAPGRYVRARA